MATLTPQQVEGYAKAAGFTGGDLRIIVAIAQAESGFDTQAHNPGHAGDPENSWGIWQINIAAHTQVTVEQATDPTFAAQFSYQLYRAAGNRFADWGTYNTGAYKNTPYWKSGAGITLPPIPVGAAWTAQDSLRVWPWLTKDGVNPVINNPYHSSFEAGRGAVQDGVGLSVALDTTITSLTSGTVMAAAFGQAEAPPGENWNFGGYIVIKSQIPFLGGAADVFYRHMDTLEVKQGDTVMVGQVLGLSGGQLVGGVNPESSTFTTGPHLDAGINPTSLQFHSPGPNIDPAPWLRNLLVAGPPVRDRLHIIVGGALPGPVGTVVGNIAQGTVLLADQAVMGTGVIPDSFLGIEQALDNGLTYVPIDWSTASSGLDWKAFLPWNWKGAADTVQTNLQNAIGHNIGAGLWRFLIGLAGFILIMAFLLNMMKALGDETGATGVVQGAGKAAQTAATAAAVAA